jgi:hypothetical protein
MGIMYCIKQYKVNNYVDVYCNMQYVKGIMNRLIAAKRVQVISALVEEASINGIVRMTGVAKHTVLRLDTCGMSQFT